MPSVRNFSAKAVLRREGSQTQLLPYKRWENASMILLLLVKHIEPVCVPDFLNKHSKTFLLVVHPKTGVSVNFFIDSVIIRLSVTGYISIAPKGEIRTLSHSIRVTAAARFPPALPPATTILSLLIPNISA